MSNYRIET